MRIALYQPEIAGNMGAVLRLSACLNVTCDIIEPCGFPFSDKSLKRAGMDYADAVEIERHLDASAFIAHAKANNRRIVLMTTKGSTSLFNVEFQPDDIILMGSESSGAPEEIHAAADLRIRIPMQPQFRSLNVSVAAGIALAEALRQTGQLPPGVNDVTLSLDTQQQSARDWFEALRTRICYEFEAIEREAGSDARFDYLSWDRTDHDSSPGGGGVRGVMKGKVFEKVGVNVSTVGGAFNPEFAQTIHGAAEDPSFFATGISLVAHMANPHVPAVHMNTRFLATTKRWFGGGADLNPPVPYQEDTDLFHARLRAACAPYGPDVYEQYKKWADDYFWIPHRQVHRGVGGIFYDHLESDSDAMFDRNFALTRDVGEAFLDVFPKIVRKRMGQKFTEAEKMAQRKWRGLYAEFNLVYDRGTTFGLKTGGNVDAILMSLPPEVVWE